MLFDHNISEHLRSLLPGCEAATAKEMLWNQLRNGDLLRAGEDAGFEVMLTADQSIWYQQNNIKRRIALVVVNTNRIRIIRLHVQTIGVALLRSSPGSYEFLELVPRAPNASSPADMSAK